MKYLFFLGVLLLVGFNANAYGHWTAEVEKVFVDKHGKAMVFLSNPRNSSSGALSCEQNTVWLGSKDNAANSSFLSQALMVYVANKTVRIGIHGSGSSCIAEYMTAE